MPGDRLLGTLLRSLQTYTNQQDTPRLLGTASSLLTTLNNPLNVTLLTSQILSAPAIWAQPNGLQTCMRCLSVFHSAAQSLVRYENARKDESADAEFAQMQRERTLPKDDWIRAVVNGADDHSPRWRHLLVLGGLLLGFGPVEDSNLSSTMRSTIEHALVTAANLALEQTSEEDELGQQTITLVMNHCFPSIVDHERAQLNYNALLPVLLQSVLHSAEGLRSGYFLGAVDLDIRPISKTQFGWSERAGTFQEIQKMLSNPLLSSLGPLSRLIGHCIEHVTQVWLVTSAVDNVESFAKTLHLQWRQNKLSEIDPSEENVFLDKETHQRTAPQLWKLLKSALFAVVIMLRSAMGRVLSDTALAKDRLASNIAAQSLLSLRNLYFIFTRMSSTSFSQYSFVYLTAIDIITTHPSTSETFIQNIKPTELTSVPQHPLDRNLDLFFLNTAEHFTLVLSTHSSEELLIAATSPYVAVGGNNNLLPIFEAAHSLMLAIFSAPQNADLTARHLPFYIDTLFSVFPSNLTARQFRLAFKTLLRLTSPPSILSGTQPMLSAVLLELLYERTKHASVVPVFPKVAEGQPEADAPLELSEQAVLVLTLIDTLTELSLDLLDEWLPLVADVVNVIGDASMREHCKMHFWNILVDGEMDPDRSQLCHAWWSTDGGRENVMYGHPSAIDQQVAMSGALPDESKDSKL